MKTSPFSLMDFKKEVAQLLSDKLSQQVSLSQDNVFSLIEVPKDLSFGDFAFPCFRLAKELKKSPVQIAQDLAKDFSEDDRLSEHFSLQAVGPYLNFKIKTDVLANSVFSALNEQGDNYGSGPKNDDVFVIDYSAPNVAKNMGIHNLRSTIIGQSLVNILRFNGSKVIGVNHLGDWGTQFGKLIWALEKWSSVEELKEKGILFLNELYVRFHSEYEKTKDESMEEEARAWFKKIEDGDERARMWWKLFVDISMKEYNKIYERLHASFDYVLGESFYIQFLDESIKKFEDAGLVSKSEGALVVEFDESEGMPPLLLKKSDGATLYGTRDIAAALYRLKTYSPTKVLYLTDVAQELHFKQVFKALEMLDSATKGKFEHVKFGRLSFPDGSMSTRKGNIVALNEVLDKSVEKVLSIIEEKNPGLENKSEVAEKVGVGAIIFGDLYNDRINNIIFEWDNVLDFQGESAPYVQYVIARINSMLEKVSLPENVDYSLISTDAERILLKKLFDFPEVIREVASDFKPHHLAKYLVSLAQEFNSYYAHNKILQDDEPVQFARLTLARSVASVLKKGLLLLGIESPERM